MAFTLLASTIAVNSAGPTSNIDTTGADLIIVTWVWDNRNGLSGNVSDSKSNSWSVATAYGVGDLAVKMSYAWGTPSVGSGHNFSAFTQFGAVGMVTAWSGAKTSSDPYDQHAVNNTAPGTSVATGSVTPTESDELLITALVSGIGGSGYSADSGFTNLFSQNFANDPGGNQGAGLAYKIQTSAAAVNPTWSWSGSASTGVLIATFKAASGSSGGGTFPALIVAV
jgi:hypothetical protein